LKQGRRKIKDFQDNIFGNNRLPGIVKQTNGPESNSNPSLTDPIEEGLLDGGEFPELPNRKPGAKVPDHVLNNSGSLGGEAIDQILRKSVN
jgi:hypothetical protein